MSVQCSMCAAATVVQLVKGAKQMIAHVSIQ